MSIKPEEMTPSEDERKRLLDALARLVDRRGVEPLVAWPIFEPCREHFPDVLAPTRRSIRTHVRRLMAYAKLDGIDVELDAFDSDNPYDEIDDDGTLRRPPQHAAAWFAGIEGGVARFAVDIRQLDDIEKLVGILCHEIAHAYRERHRIVVRDHEVEEQATDLTTVYLGFGILTANNTYRYRTGGRVDGAMVSYRYAEERLGYLPSASMCYLLAVQCALRDDEALVERVLSHLEPTQRKMFKASRRGLDPESLAETLRLPPRAEWPPSVEGDALAAATVVRDQGGDDDDDEDDRELITDRIVAENQGTNVYRLADDKRLLGLGSALVGGLVLGLWLSARGVFGNEMAYVVAGGLGWVGYQIGKRRPVYTCTGDGCDARIVMGATTCSRCGGTIAGTVQSKAELLDD